MAKSSKIVRRAVEESEVEMAGVDMQWVCLVIAMASTEEELQTWDIQHLIPKRRYCGNRRPGLTSKEIFWSKDEWREGSSLWEPTQKFFTTRDRRRLIARLAYIGVKECFRSHAYKFKQETYIQKDGGPIGLKLTTVVAELVMAEWDLRFREKLALSQKEVKIL